MDSLFRIEMLGRFGVRQGSREITRFRTQKTSALLAYLAFYGARAHARTTLTELFWPESDLKAARTNLRVALNALRKQLEPPGVTQGAILSLDHTQVCLNSLAFTTDVEDFEATLREAEAQKEKTEQVVLWTRAIDLYAGDLLPSFYEDWTFI
jgi:DNA-binding SARP family transcriptional activator